MRPAQQHIQTPIQHLQQTNTDERNRRISNISNNSNVSTDSQHSETIGMAVDERKVSNMPNQHIQQVYTIQQQHDNIANGILLPGGGTTEVVQQTQQVIHHNTMHSVATGTMPPASSQMSTQTTVTTEAAPKVKVKEVSSTLPDLAQNLANILSNPKSKAVHSIAQGHEPLQNPAVIQPVLHSEQYFQPIQPEMCLQNIQIQHQMQQNVQQVRITYIEFFKLNHVFCNFYPY